MVEGGEGGGQGGGQEEGKGGWGEEGGEGWCEEQEENLREGGDDSTGLVFLGLFFLFCFSCFVFFFLIPFLARENDAVRAMSWQGRNCENWLNSRNEQMADDKRPKTMITSARDDCYAFFLLCVL